MSDRERMRLVSLPARLLAMRLDERLTSGKKSRTVTLKFSVATAAMIVAASESLLAEDAE